MANRNEYTELPKAFCALMQNWLGTEATSLFEALASPPTRGLRLSGCKAMPLHIPSLLVPHLNASIPWTPDGYYIDVDAALGKTVLHEAGAYYLQEPSAMAIALAVAPQTGERILDLCAAPGGKTTHLASLLSRAGGGRLVANEFHPTRVRALAENIERVGARAAIVNESPDRLATAWPSAFDAVLVDAPCSGEGMFRKDPQAANQWQADSPDRCQMRQQEILISAIKLLKPGGRLVYSTCTFNPLENERIVAWLLDSFPLSIDPLPEWPGWSSGRPEWAFDRPELLGTRRLWPHLARGEGHFVARLRLAEDALPMQTTRVRAVRPTKNRRDWSAWLSSTVADPPSTFVQPRIQKDMIFSDELGDLPTDGLRVLRPGCPLATWKTDQFSPHHALSRALPANAFPSSIELDEAEAMAYLRGEALDNPKDLRGFVHLAYAGYGLGFAKGAPGRLNNLYPKGLRSAHLEPLERPH
ncbi:NOL1/NOP2/sun family putative RNA methylase [Alicyclobacillus sacchari]|uniref:NOL1/NOP2/sun family putative RNA methylase n=1 Tax=Alicyclobacillus sacchari TaxID=392010 RepID=A0A4R8LTS4_9BACL|nr:RsmB/NOP family class I SAM-dependent RNA methyltransferase [Alicyclobacillus sacchari]TDY51014.1 NOL1/NOP2/sun family putative RNA methylase [Alicyclobacillus sacchari]GMA56219.1 23S rRNA methyltransferase [Alicyclobacillus sacchari]